MDNIFSNAKFGDKFITRDGRIAIYWQQIVYPEEYMCLTFILENECIETDLYDGVTLSNGIKISSNTDIVSRYYEEIDEDKLESIQCECLAEDVENGVMDKDLRGIYPNDDQSWVQGYAIGFIRGYKKAKENCSLTIFTQANSNGSIKVKI